MEETTFYNYLNKTNLDGIKGGMFKNKSYSGYSSQVLKSGICKYYRRKMFDKFEYCVIDMMLFSPERKAIMTNLFNRLRILLMEEIIFSELGQLIQCIGLLNNIEIQPYENQMQRILKFCSIVKTCKRGRIISYIRAYYKIHGSKNIIQDIELNKVLKYKKSKDSIELLQYGELFIKYMDEKSFINNAFAIYNILYNNKDNIISDSRYRRKDPVFLLFEIIEDRYFNNKTIAHFFRTMFFRKSMIERHAFGFWYLCFAWKRDIDFNNNNIDLEDINLQTYFSNRNHMEINDDFVVKDYHVNKNYGLAKFGNIGSKVIDEDLSILGNNGEYFRQIYIDDKNGITSKKVKLNIKDNTVNTVNTITNDAPILKNKIKFKVKSKSKVEYNNFDDSKLEVIPLDSFNDIEVLQDGVCGLKVCCIKASYNGNTYILKEMRKSFNYGRDYVLLDELKEEFGIRAINMQRIKCDQHLTRVDKSKRTLVNNWKWDYEETYYCKMEIFDNIGDLGKHKQLLEDNNIFRECLKIRLYDGLFCSSDNILRNILVNLSKQLLSIDEADIYGKRKEIFNKKDWFLKNENKNKAKEYAEEIINEWDLENKINMVKDTLIKYGFSDKVDIMTNRFLDYKNIVYKEFM
jgi:hypothetical protein